MFKHGGSYLGPKSCISAGLGGGGRQIICLNVADHMFKRSLVYKNRNLPFSAERNTFYKKIGRSYV